MVPRQSSPVQLSSCRSRGYSIVISLAINVVCIILGLVNEALMAEDASWFVAITDLPLPALEHVWSECYTATTLASR